MPGLLLIPPIVYYGIHFYLHSTGTLWFPIFIELPLVLGYFEIKVKSRGKAAQSLKYSSLASFSILVILFLMFIVMLPESLYQAWLKLLEAHRPTGMISFAFAYAGGLVSSIGCASLIRWKNKVQALLNLLLLCNMIVLILYPQIAVLSVFLILLLIKLLIIQRGNPGSVILLSLAFIFIPAITSAFLFPLQNPSPRGSRVVDVFSGSVQKTVYRIFPGLPLVLQIPGYGFGYDQVRKTGERPVLSSNIIFTLEAEPGTVLYLRSDVFYIYKNGVWLSESPGVGLENSAFTDTGRYRMIKLTLETDIYTRVLHNSWTEYYGMNGSLTALDSQGSYETASGLPLSRGDIITLYDRIGKAPEPDDETLQNQLERGIQIPSDLETELSDLAHNLEGESHRESLSKIKEYFRNEFRYTLDTRSSENMVLDFINETKEGYCVHFSTSAALLARIIGIPVRMAEGFLVQIPDPADGEIHYKGDSHSVTGYSAHQWPEIYIKERGWIPWEVTPPFEALGESMIQDNLTLDDYTREQLMRMGIVRNEEDKAENLSPVHGFYLNFYAIMLIAVILLIIFIFILMYRSANLMLVLNRKIKQAEKRSGTAPPSQTGWLKWFRPQKSVHKNRCQSLILKYVYHKNSLGKDEKKELLKLLRELEI